MRSIGRTDIGRVRPTNQDAFVCGKLSDTMTFAVVCDGMGGAKAGNVASTMATKTIVERLASSYRENVTLTSMRHAIDSAVCAANAVIFDTMKETEQLEGMGTTVVVAVAQDNKAIIGHVGDSRAYLIANGEIQQITRDHSVVQEMVESGKLTQQEANHHPRKHYITRAIGAEFDVECEFDEVDIPEGGAILLCTDGLTNMVETSQIQKILRSYPPDTAADRLISAANMAGGSDNITVALIY
ncbi:MAG: Stp1/IreP family PP2C-type Ser/Thr phosphatase [Clostridia bacterium]|nr:Stp1/IreP family PP2C-type Ser/Thr phosphatase [Clostridia bacterium]